MRLSTGLMSKLADTSSIQDAIAGFVIDIYSGVQPATPDAAAAGALLVSITDASGAFTPETPAVGSATVTGGSGSVDTVTVNGVDILGASVPFNSNTSFTAIDVAAQINRNPKNRNYVATLSGAQVILTAVNGLGTLPNAYVVSSTGTCTMTYANMSGGVNAVNGLNFGNAAAGVISKSALQTWSGTAGATGTAAWFRIRGAGDTGAGASTTAVRIDGNIATSGADMTVGSLAVTSGAPFIIPVGTITVPQL